MTHVLDASEAYFRTYIDLDIEDLSYQSLDGLASEPDFYPDNVDHDNEWDSERQHSAQELQDPQAFGPCTCHPCYDWAYFWLETLDWLTCHHEKCVHATSVFGHNEEVMEILAGYGIDVQGELKRMEELERWRREDKERMLASIRARQPDYRSVDEDEFEVEHNIEDAQWEEYRNNTERRYILVEPEPLSPATLERITRELDLFINAQRAASVEKQLRKRAVSRAGSSSTIDQDLFHGFSFAASFTSVGMARRGRADGNGNGRREVKETSAEISSKHRIEEMVVAAK